MRTVRTDAAIIAALSWVLFVSLLAAAFPVPPVAHHRASRKRPTWTATPLYHALGLQELPGSNVALARPRRAGAPVYANLAKLSRFTRALALPNRTVVTVRAATPPEEMQ